MTLTGTNSYIIGNGKEVAVLDPGPDIESHIVALIENAPAPITKIVVTHGHPDHYPGASRLREMTGAPIYAHAAAPFEHQENIANGEAVTVEGVTLRAIFTPGHAHDHLCFFLEEEAALFTGDLILGTGTTIVAPPKGDMAQYMASLRLLETEWEQTSVIYGGHGPEISRPLDKFREYINHRLSRQQQLLGALEMGPSTIGEIVARIYTDVDKRLWPAAGRQVLAYLLMLEREGVVNSVDSDVTEADSVLNPSGVPIDPVAAAELGISNQETGKPEKTKKYTLVKAS